MTQSDDKTVDLSGVTLDVQPVLEAESLILRLTLVNHTRQDLTFSDHCGRPFFWASAMNKRRQASIPQSYILGIPQRVRVTVKPGGRFVGEAYLFFNDLLDHLAESDVVVSWEYTLRLCGTELRKEFQGQLVLPQTVKPSHIT
jgi:hypothetical protein